MLYTYQQHQCEFLISQLESLPKDLSTGLKKLPVLDLMYETTPINILNKDTEELL